VSRPVVPHSTDVRPFRNAKVEGSIPFVSTSTSPDVTNSYVGALLMTGSTGLPAVPICCQK
jgi:hypothetical protein